MGVVTQKWWAVITPTGAISDVRHMRAIAEATLMMREDRDQCRLVPATVTVDLTPPPKQPMLPPPKGKKGRR